MTTLGHPLSPCARDITRYVQCFDDAIDTDFCQRMIESFHSLVRFHARNGRGAMARLEESAWTELNVTKVADASFEQYFHEQVIRYLALYNERVALTLPVPPRTRMENLRIKRYSVDAGDRFQPHFDALDYCSNRYMVFLWYLNDVLEGGETEFCDLGLRIQAKRGRLLMFPPYWMFQHAGLPPRSNDKYMISTYLLF
ncbi:MAG: 2OG-Fe(II) oxygenase [Rhodanobacteraceae bacterium]|nr:MAG: 2OG-Fe(II) oxygenase [Rhodanobacteraceae bacterium]